MESLNTNIEQSFESLMEEGKNPGLGIRELQEQGINGSGINVAIIDQKLDIEHDEFRGKISKYIEIGSSKDEKISMHGPGVTSLLVGQNCGVAPEAKLFYVATPCGRDFNFKAEAIRKIIEENTKRPKGKKIRLISSSVGYQTQNPEPGLKEYILAIKEAEESGIIFIDVGDKSILDFIGGGTNKDKDDPENYIGWSGLDTEEKIRVSKDSTVVPCDFRTFASPKEKKYEYKEKAGMSWSVPYLAGIITLMFQINPNLTKEEISLIINKTIYTNKNGLKIINPKGIIEETKKSTLNNLSAQ